MDPDANGAIACLRWTNAAGSDAVAAADPIALAAAATIEIYDMPMQPWRMAKREKRRPDPEALLELFSRLLGGDAQEGQGEDGGSSPLSTISRAAIEFTTPTHLSGKFAWYDSGFASGLITGLLTATCLPYERISARAWKRQLGLFGAGKEGSLALAKQLFPQAADLYLKRKKDHGRAEALLICAWAVGVRAEPVWLPPTDDEDEEEYENNE